MHSQLAHNFLRVVNWQPSNPEIGPVLLITSSIHTPITADAWGKFLHSLTTVFETLRSNPHQSPAKSLTDILTSSTAAYLSARAYDTDFSIARFVDQFLTSYAAGPYQRSELIGRHPFRLTRFLRLGQRYNNQTITNDLAFGIAGDVIRQELVAINECFHSIVLSLTSPPEEIDTTIRDIRQQAESSGQASSIMLV